MPKHRKPDYVGAAELCQEAGIDRSTLSRHVAFGKIRPALRAGKGRTAAMLFDRREADAYIATLKLERSA
jgi:predicted site-specific integrase-resolvase